MLYSINGKCYVNIAPSVYIEVIISEDGSINPTNNRIEVNGNTIIGQTTLYDEIKKIQKKVDKKPSQDNYEMNRHYNKRKK